MTILDLLRRIKEGIVVLPAIQRDFAWLPKRIFRLVDSILQGFPIGIVLLWETYEEVLYRTFVSDLWPGHRHPIQVNRQRRKLGVVLDGQQRLQSLYSALCGTYQGKSLYLDVLSGKDIDEWSRQKYHFKFMDAVDLKRWQSMRERAAKYGPSAHRRRIAANQGPQYFVRVADLYSCCMQEKAALRKRLAKEFTLSEADEERVEMNLCSVNEILTHDSNILKVAFIDEDLPSDSPRRKTESDVLEIFVRINREGTPLSRSDLTFSILKLNWKESAVSLPEFVEQINAGNSFHLDTDFVIRCLFAVSDLGTKFDPDLLRKPSMVERLRGNFHSCCNAIRSTLDTVQKECWCSRSDLIGGANTLVPFVYYLFHTRNHEVPPDQVLNFRKSLYLFGFAKPFSWNAEGRLRKFLRRELQPLVERGDSSFPLAAAVWWVKYWEGYTTFSHDLLQSNPALAVHVLQGGLGAKAQYWRNAAELDHIFPRAELLKKGFDEADIDHFANLWLLPKGRNMNKSNRHPAEYFQDVDDGEMKTALIDRDLLDYPGFKTFLKKRSKEMLEAIRRKLEFTDRDFQPAGVPSLRAPALRIPPASIAEMGQATLAKR